MRIITVGALRKLNPADIKDDDLRASVIRNCNSKAPDKFRLAVPDEMAKLLKQDAPKEPKPSK